MMDSITKQITELREGEELAFRVRGRDLLVSFRIAVENTEKIAAIDAAESAGVIDAKDADQKRRQATMVYGQQRTVPRSWLHDQLLLPDAARDVVANGRAAAGELREDGGVPC